MWVVAPESQRSAMSHSITLRHSVEAWKAQTLKLFLTIMFQLELLLIFPRKKVRGVIEGMDSERLFDIFVDEFMYSLKPCVTSSIKNKFILEMEKKGDKMYLKGEALAKDVAAHCNLCGEICLPLYFQDNVVRKKVDLGLNYYTSEMLLQCNNALDNKM